MYETETKSENTYGQLVHEIPNLEVKRFCELVITGLSAMQRLLFYQENHGEIHYYSNHQAPQNNIKSTKTAQNSILRLPNFRLNNSSNLSSPA